MSQRNDYQVFYRHCNKYFQSFFTDPLKVVMEPMGFYEVQYKKSWFKRSVIDFTLAGSILVLNTVT